MVSALTDPVVPVAKLLDFAGQTVVVTGASGGIGRAVAQRFADAGATVVSHWRTTKPDPAGRKGLDFQGDLSLIATAEDLAQFAVEQTGRLDVWINNAALQPVSSFLELDAEAERLVVDTNIGFVMRGTRAAAKRVGPSGLAIVNIASIEGLVPATGHSHYGAAKAAIVHHTKATAAELGSLGVRVNAVAPGLIDRPGLQDDWPSGVNRWTAAAPLQRLGTGTDVADACLFLGSAAARWITGATLVVDGGMLTVSPW